MKKYLISIAAAALALAPAIALAASQKLVDDGMGGTYLDARPSAGPLVVTKGWQPTYPYTVPPSTVSLFFHYPCPSSFPVVWNGAFAFSAANGNQTQQVYLQYNGPRQDENPESYGEWGWHFYWPGGSPNPTVINFQSFCQRVQ